MQKIRVIPTILYKNGQIVQSRNFQRHQIVGSPQVIINRLSSWNADEVIYLDISRTKKYSVRTDTKFTKLVNFIDVIKEISKYSFMPLTVGGGIRSMKDAEQYLENGADKISINHLAIHQTDIISSIAKLFGSQFCVISVDAKLINKEYFVFDNYGKINTGIKVKDHIKNICEMGAGEIIINSIDSDGKGSGYDIDLINLVCQKSSVPVIPLGGVGAWSDFEECLNKTKVNTVSASNIFQHTENSYYNAVDYLYKKNINVRKPKISNLKLNKDI
jgi:cyclase